MISLSGQQVLGGEANDQGMEWQHVNNVQPLVGQIVWTSPCHHEQTNNMLMPRLDVHPHPFGNEYHIMCFVLFVESCGVGSGGRRKGL